MHLRRLPVTVAGHWLTPNCVTILQQGSFLLAPPWQGGWLRASDLDNLGKASDEERAVAKEWVREKNKEQHNNKAQNGKAQNSKEQNAVPSKEKQKSSTSCVAANIAKESNYLSF